MKADPSIMDREQGRKIDLRAGQPENGSRSGSNVTDVRQSKSAKPPQWTTLTELGTQIDISAEQPVNEYPGISDSLHPGSKVSDVRFVISRRAPAEITVSDAGRESDFNIAHPENAFDSILSSSEGDSKVIEDNVEQSRRHSLPSKRILLGT
jgi:hypothetical protein